MLGRGFVFVFVLFPSWKHTSVKADVHSLVESRSILENLQLSRRCPMTLLDEGNQSVKVNVFYCFTDRRGARED